jgi:membrane protease YdiL (CAAX protease family)
MLNSRLFIIVFYLLGACFLGCLLAYPIYSISTLDFDRALSRSILVSVVLLFYPAYKFLQFNSSIEVGLVKYGRVKTTYHAWLVGIAMLMPLTIFFFSCGFRVWEPLHEQSLVSASAAITLAILSGLVIGSVEETLFRGFIQTSLITNYSPILSLLLVNCIYSSVHFLEAPELSPTENLYWFSGFILFLSAFKPLLSLHQVWDSWLALFMAGIFLSVVRLRTNNLFWCIGIHAGWVAHIKIVKTFTDKNSSTDCKHWAGDYDNYIGELSMIWICFLLISWWFFRRKNPT